MLIMLFACIAKPPANATRVPHWATVRDGTPRDIDTGLPLEVTDSATGIELVLIPPGSYVRGNQADDAPGEETPAHCVTISNAFYLAKYETTQSQWRRMMGQLPGMTRSLGGNVPVFDVCWDEVQAFLGRAGYRLPTEAEWEYACRAGTTAPTYGEIDAIAWHVGNTDDYRAVGLKKPNAFGLYDMLGNVCEWCADCYGPTEYDRCKGGVTDPSGPASGEERVLRGLHIAGGSAVITASVRYGGRTNCAPGTWSAYQGFRVARDP
jgi:formylglycine-generating enzyme required for sulfatase activity